MGRERWARLLVFECEGRQVESGWQPESVFREADRHWRMEKCVALLQIASCRKQTRNCTASRETQAASKCFQEVQLELQPGRNVSRKNCFLIRLAIFSPKQHASVSSCPVGQQADGGPSLPDVWPNIEYETFNQSCHTESISSARPNGAGQMPSSRLARWRQTVCLGPTDLFVGLSGWPEVGLRLA